MNQLDMIAQPHIDVGDDADFWPTPEYVIRAVVPIIQSRLDRGHRVRPHLLDPGCGDGAIADTIGDCIECCSINGIEIHPERAAQAERRICSSVQVGDFLDPAVVAQWHEITNASKRPLLIVMNSPYSKPRETIGLEFAEQAIRCAEPSKGLVVALFPLDYATGKARVERLHDRHQSALYPLKGRPKFANGQTGKRPVAWFVFDLLNPYSEWGVLQV